MNSGWVSAIIAVLGFLVTGSVLLGSWRVSRNTTAVTQYRDTALAWEGKAKAQEAEIADLRHDLESRDQKISELTARVSVLQDTVTGKAALEILDSRTSEMLQLAGEMRTELRKNAEILVAIQRGLGTAMP